MECKTCRFFEPYDKTKTVGQCRRYPPIQDGQGLNTIDKPPTVSGAGWCGEHKRKDKK